MSVEIVMPQLGLTMTEGSVSTWLKKPGDAIKKDEIILAVSTDKVDMDVESPSDGTLGEILIETGITVPVGTVLAHILVGNETCAPSAAIASSKELVQQSPKERSIPSTPIPPKALVREGRIVASPRARKIATACHVSLSNVRGSGPNGRIVAADVETALSATPSKQDKTPSRRISNTNVRRRQVIADRMVESVRTIPAFSISVEVNAAQLVILYENLRDHIAETAGTKLTYTDLLLKALAIGLNGVPEVNAFWEEEATSQADQINIAMAVATDHGVVAPVLHNIDKMSLDQLVHARSQMTQKARESKLSFADLEGASGTLSNLGMYRVDRFEGIITPRQTFILAVGQLKSRPWIVDDTVTMTSTMVLTLSVDHRVVDGAIAARFLEQVAEAIENPYRLLWSVGSVQARAKE